MWAGISPGQDVQDSDARAFTERCADDRHHFRFIISPDDALEMTDLRAHPRLDERDGA
jgi:type IV secretory pathway VirD2 relaxase